MKIYIIAEIGINHNGSLPTAFKLIEMAKSAGCDAVKFQKRDVETVYSKKTLDSPRESPWGKTTRDQKVGLEFGFSEYKEIDSFCKKNEIDWFASAWDEKSQEFLKQFDLPHNKIASAMVTKLDFLEVVAREKKHTFVSTGMTTLNQIRTAVDVFKKHDCPITLLHTVSIYPCPEEDLNLRMITTLKKEFNLPVGYSGHEVSPIPSIIAVSLGAIAIERHITLDRSMYGTDQSASLEKRGVEQLVAGVRTFEKVIGDGKKIFSTQENEIARKLRYWENN